MSRFVRILTIATTACLLVACGGDDRPPQDSGGDDAGHAGSDIDRGAGDTGGPGGGTQDGGASDAGPQQCVHDPDAKLLPTANPCLSKYCKDGHWTYVPSNIGGGCDDGRACTEGDKCVAGKCRGTLKPCAKTGDDCSTATRDPKTCACVITHKPVDTICEDGHHCTASTRCNADGECRGGTFLCGCIPDALLKTGSKWLSIKGIQSRRCPTWVATGNACLGRQYCVTDRKNPDGTPAYWSCETLPGTNRQTGLPQDKCEPPAHPCETNDCDTDTKSPTAGKCVKAFRTKGHPCDDGDKCTSNDACNGQGVCNGPGIKPPSKCKCTPANAKTQCAYLIGDTKCKQVYCDTAGGPPHKCVINKAAEIKCNDTDNSWCRTNVCDPKTGVCELKTIAEAKPGLWVKTEGKTCDDGDQCTSSETCFQGVCAAPDPVAKAKLLADADPSNDNHKTGGEGTVICQCQKDADCLSKDDGDLCNGTLQCNKAKGTCEVSALTVVTCDQSQHTQCLRNMCWPSLGVCVPTPLPNILKIIFLPTFQGDPYRVVLRPFPYPVYPFVACDDGNPCTTNDECKQASCVAGGTNLCACKSDADCAGSSGSDKCLGALKCDANGGCVASPANAVHCPTPAGLDPCHFNGCDPKTGKCKLLTRPDLVTCGDGTQCKSKGACLDGKCQLAAQTCQCAKDADCAGKGGSGLQTCAGVYYCNKATSKCAVDPGQPVVCDKSFDKPCVRNICDPLTAKCKMTASPKYALCDDGDPCTWASRCHGVKCEGKGHCPCKQASDCAVFDSGDPCVGQMICDASSGTGRCRIKAGSAIVCDTGKDGACVQTKCQSGSGKCAQVALADGLPCDDGNTCGGAAACKSGQCKADKSCACKADADCKAHEDGDLCNGTLVCKAGQCAVDPQTFVGCPAVSGKGCLRNECDPKTGQCALQPGPGCSDANPCTTDACQTDGKCAHTPVADGTSCGSQAVCQVGKCVAAPAGMALVPAGLSVVGCNKAKQTCGADELPQHQVKTKSFWLDRLEVTRWRYEKCVAAGKCKAPAKGAGCSDDEKALSRPVRCVTHADAAAFCKWDGGKRLPTEAEFEKAQRGLCVGASGCAGPQNKVWVWGNAPATCQHAVLGKDAKGGKCADKVQQVGGRMHTDAGPYGHFDLAGNTREWTADGYDAGFYAKAAATKDDPKAPAAAKMAVRGGSIAGGPAQARIAARSALEPAKSASDVGFRCAKGY